MCASAFASACDGPARARRRHDRRMTEGRPLATGTERPIFLDETGRRARRVRAACTAGGAAAALWLAAIVSGPLGFGRLPSASPAALVLRAMPVMPHAHRLPGRVSLAHAVVEHRRRSLKRRT
jgi:hypothetical protein